MPNMQPVNLLDRQPTPVAHTFKPSGFVTGAKVYGMRESTGIPINDNTMAISLHGTPTRLKPRIKLNVPVIGSSNNLDVDGNPSTVLVRTARVAIEFDFDRTSTMEERNDVVGMIRDLLTEDKLLFHDLIVGLEDVY